MTDPLPEDKRHVQDRKEGKGGAGMVVGKKVRRPVKDHGVVRGPSLSFISYLSQPSSACSSVGNGREGEGKIRRTK